MVKKPKINHQVKNGSITLNLNFRSCRPSQIKGRAVWKLVDCHMRLPFKVQVGDMELQPRMVVKIWMKPKQLEAQLHLARQAAEAALSEPVYPPDA
jgi:hypothetical protein